MGVKDEKDKNEYIRIFFCKNVCWYKNNLYLCTRIQKQAKPTTQIYINNL